MTSLLPLLLLRRGWQRRLSVAQTERQMRDRCVAKGASAEGAIVAEGLALKALVIVMRRSAK